MKRMLASVIIAIATIGFVSSSNAATKEEKATYKAATDQADAEYKMARDKCKELKGNEKDVCSAEAKAARIHTKANAEAAYKKTPKAEREAREDIADADYAVAKAKCGSKSGNDKDVCIKEAKVVKTNAMMDSKANQKSSEARKDAREEKRDAAKDLAEEKCESLTGQAKQNCEMKAKAK